MSLTSVSTEEVMYESQIQHFVLCSVKQPAQFSMAAVPNQGMQKAHGPSTLQVPSRTQAALGLRALTKLKGSLAHEIGFNVFPAKMYSQRLALLHSENRLHLILI